MLISMTNNGYFPDCTSLVNELRDLQEQFIKALSDAGLKDLEKVSLKNNLRGQLIQKLKQLGEYAATVSKGEDTLMLSSGFPVIRPVDEIILDTPDNFRISPGVQNGEIVMQVQRVMGAKSYMYQYTPHPVTKESIWESVYDTRCKATLTGLPLGVRYWFRIAAVGARKQIVYTDALDRYIA